MIALGGVAVLVATFLAGVVGFAYGLIALPLLLVIGVPLPVVIVVNLLIGLVTRVGVVVRMYRRINLARTSLLVGGSVPGMVVGLLVRGWVSSRATELAAGALTVGAVAVLLWLPPREADSSSVGATLGAGGLGGLLGVTTSLNGIPPALLLLRQRVAATSMVADLGAYFVVANALTVVLLVSREAHGFGSAWPYLAAWLPLGVIGQAVGVSLGGRMPQTLFRRLVFIVVLASGVTSILRAL